MKSIEDQIFEIVEHVWDAFVGMPLTRRSSQDIHGAEGYYLVASLHIEGAWEGEVALVCSEELAYQVAAHLFEIARDEVTADDIREALGELSNIIGGNLKRLLPEPSHLHLPVVGYNQRLRVRVDVPEHAHLPRVLADCMENLLLVVLADHSQSEKIVIHEL